jgi:hypothetical protein
LNLVKISEDLKGVPMQALQAYMNGMNPEVPPYLAQGELMRRQKQMEKQQMAGGAQGPMPSVKEQLEQAAEKMALDQQRQQQGMEQMGQQARQQPMPAQEGTPQPEMQPQGQGVAGLPVPENMFNMAGGGVVGYQGGGDVKPTRRQGESFADFRKRLFEWELQQGAREDAARQQERAAREQERQRLLQERGGELIPPSPFFDRAPLPTAGASRPAPTPTGPDPSDARFARGPAAMGITNQPPAVPRPEPQAGLPAVLPGAQAPRPQGGAPAPQAGIPAAMPQAPAATSSDQMSADLLKKVEGMKGPEVNLEQIGAQEQQLQKQSGLAGLAEQQAAIEKMYERQKKGELLNRLQQGLAAGSAYGTGGYGYGSMMARKARQDADLRMGQWGLEQATARAEKSYDTQSAMLKEADKNAREWANEQRKQGISIQAKDIEARRNLEMKALEQKQALQLEGIRQSGADRRAAMGGSGGAAGGYDRERMEQLKLLQRNIQDQLNTNKNMSYLEPARYKELTQRLAQVESALAQAVGLPVESGTGATSATNPTGLDLSKWGNPKVK